MNEEFGTLRKDQFELLWQAERINDDGGEPVVVSNEAITAVREALGGPLSETLGLHDEAIDAMSLEALAAAVTPDDDDESSPVLDTLEQTPETGGQDAADLAADQDDDEPEGFEALSGDQQAEVREKLTRAARFDHRLPQHCESLRNEAVAMVPGVESIEELETELDLGSA